jgi:hypothetical protein
VTLVILLFPNGQRKEVILSATPRKGEQVLLEGANKALSVENVLWMEASNGHGPVALISVREVP